MSAIGPGDWVECIDSDSTDLSARFGSRSYVTGGLSVVEEVGEDDYGPWLNCVGKIRPADIGAPQEQGFGVEFFRLIYRPKAEIIEPLKAIPRMVTA